MAVPEFVNESKLVVIDYAAAKPTGEYIASNTFTAGEYEWEIIIYPSGVSEEYSNYVSMYASLSKEPEDGRSVLAMVELTLMDQSGYGNHRAKTCFGRASPQTVRKRWGYKKYISKSDLEKSDYLRDNCLKIFCTIGVMSVAKAMAPARSFSFTEMSSPNLFLIQGYSTMKDIAVRNFVSSNKFTAGGCDWEIHFYPNGKNLEDRSSYVSVHVSLASKVSNVQAFFEITLIDQSGKGKHKVQSSFSDTLPSTLKWSGSKWGYKRFLKKAILEMSDYLRDDCLMIYCTVGVVSAVDCSRRSIKVPDSDIGSQIGMLLDGGEGSDITFNVSGEKLYAHRLILSVRSPKLLLGSVEGGGGTQEVVVQDMESDVFKALLHFIYNDALAENELIPSAPQISDTLTAKLMAAANRFDLGRLKTLCESRMCKCISVNSVTQVLDLADRCGAAELKDVCLKFAARNLAAIKRSDGFEQFEQNFPSLKSEILKTVRDEESAGSARRVRKRVEKDEVTKDE